jgi:hypothetical protein
MGIRIRAIGVPALLIGEGVDSLNDWGVGIECLFRGSIESWGSIETMRPCFSGFVADSMESKITVGDEKLTKWNAGFKRGEELVENGGLV